MQIHLVDGTFELFRAYYGAPSYKDPQGQERAAVRSLLRSLLLLLKDPDVSHVACAFDTVIESFRNQLFSGYKTGEGIDPLLYAQFPIAEKGVQALGIPVWGMRKFEADDALATGAHKFAASRNVTRVFLCSPDKDLAQCVSGVRVVCWDRMRHKFLDEKGVQKKFGVSPVSIPDYLGLTGDTADGIPGIPGWGAKSASTLLACYTHLENIPPDPEQWKAKVRGAGRLAESLNKERKEASLYKKLATLRTDVPLRETLADLKWEGPHTSSWKAFCEELGDPNLHRAGFSAS
ncbi:MAG: flap endonuclease [Bdellovibrionaceae bacterium]|nr:flap endonuclease [Pseudobdellovibrionaceae bacterium]